MNLKATPHKRVRGIIGLGSNTLTEKLAPVLLSNKIPQISTREDQYEFNDKVPFDNSKISYCSMNLNAQQIFIGLILSIYLDIIFTF